MDEDVAAANFLQEDPLCGLVKETGIIPGNVSIYPKSESQ
jgi:hypothetical protein